VILTFEPDKTFEIPEGTFSATLDEVREVRKPTSDGMSVFVRFLWRIESLSTESKIAMAAKNYAPVLHENSELRLMLEGWLGREWIEKQQKAGQVDFRSIEGHKADLVIRHIKNSSHKKPFRHVEAVLPPVRLAPIPGQVSETNNNSVAA